MNAFDPSRVDRFVISGWDRVGDELHFRYSLGEHRFIEILELPLALDGVAEHHAFAPLCDLYLLAAGVSYYKAAAPDRIVVEGIEPTAQALALTRQLYTEGLAEFRWVNGLPLDPALAIDATVTSPVSAAPAGPADGRSPRPTRALVPVGGGKDSIVTIELLRQATIPTTLFTVGEHTPLARTAAVARRPRLVARRAIDPALIELNDRGARNGHIPITAINSLAGLLAAVAGGCDAVVMSNEHSASAPTIVVEGLAVNHQYSKSLAFEAGLRAALGSVGVTSPSYFSLLRPLTELALLARFAPHTEYHRAFVSCNENYSVTGERSDGVAPGGTTTTPWCGHCPKCLFVYIGLAPFLAPAELTAIFGAELLSRAELEPGFLALFAAPAEQARPFECVGTPEECRAALAMLADDPAWSGNPGVVALLHAVERVAEPGIGGTGPAAFAWTHPEAGAFLPEALLDLVLDWERDGPCA